MENVQVLITIFDRENFERSLNFVYADFLSSSSNFEKAFYSIVLFKISRRPKALKTNVSNLSFFMAFSKQWERQNLFPFKVDF